MPSEQCIILAYLSYFFTRRFNVIIRIACTKAQQRCRIVPSVFSRFRPNEFLEFINIHFYPIICSCRFVNIFLYKNSFFILVISLKFEFLNLDLNQKFGDYGYSAM